MLEINWSVSKSFIRRLFRTTAFRLSVTYALFFTLITAFVLGGVYWAGRYYLLRQVDKQLQSSRELLIHTIGLNASKPRALRKEMQTVDTIFSGWRLFLLATPHGRPIIGSLTQWPRSLPHRQGVYTFSGNSRAIPKALRPGDSDDSEARALISRISRHGMWLILVQPLNPVDAYTDTLQVILTLALIVEAVIALIGGVAMSSHILRRMDAIHRATRQIMEGDFRQRISSFSRDDEFSYLADHLNMMFGRIESLIEGMRSVTDNIAHDLRRPLTRLRNRLERVLFQPTANEPDCIRDAVEGAVNDIDSIVHTLNALLQIAQAEAGVRRDEWRLIDLSILGADIADLYEASCEEVGIQLETRIEPVYVIGSRELLAQCLVNLMDNALKYASQGRYVGLSVRRYNEQVCLSVSDHGPGIPEQDQDRVQDRFIRLDRARSTPGNGLGLALVKAIAKLHDGQLIMSNLNSGLRVEILMPAATD